MADMFEQLNQNLAAMSLGKKIGIGLVLAGAIAGAYVLWLWTQKPDFQVLYANLSPDDAGAVIDKLKEARVPYEVSAGGGAILVPSQQVHELRLQLASQGLPLGGGVGFEIFDRTTLGTTEFVQKLNYRRALQGELARTIGQLSGVGKARVHLSIPDKSVFAARQEPARASVVVNLKSGRTLSPLEVQGIIHLVSSSVEGLAPQFVTVVDNNGRMLSKKSDSPAQDAQFDYQTKLEKDLEVKIQTMLETVVGQSKASVRVAAVLESRQVETTEEKFDPESQVIRSEQRMQDGSTSANQSAGGPPGVVSNIPGQQATPPQSTSNSSTTKKGDTVNYEINKSVSRIVEPIGVVKKLSVAALVDGTYDSVTDPKGGVTRKYIPRNEEEMKKLEELVKKTMGFSADRGDQLQVANIAFDTGALEEIETPVPFSAQMAEFMKANWITMLRYFFGFILALIVFLFVIRPTIKALVAPPPPLPVAPPLPAAAGPGGAQMAAAAGEVAGAAGMPGAPGGITSLEQAQQLAKDNPAAAANAVREWLQEG